MKHLIIGNSAAGLAAAEAIRKKDESAEIFLFSDEASPAYSRSLATYYLADKIPRAQLFLKSPPYYEQNRFVLKSQCPVKKIITSEKKIETAAGEIIAYDRLLIAAGASPVLPDIPGVKGSGVFPLRTLADIDGIVQYIPDVMEAVVLGDGLVSITTAQALHSRGIKVSIAGIADRILSQFLDSASADIIMEKMRQSGVEFHLKSSITEALLDSNGRVREVTLTNGTKLPAQLLIAAIGVKPNIDFLSGSSISCDNGVLVNEYLETSVPDIFAAGDAVQATDYLRGKALINPLWPNAVEQGMIAGTNMTGKSKRYSGSSNMNSVNIAGLSVIAAGITNTAADEKFEEYIEQSGTREKYRKLIFHDDRLVGFILLGNTSKAGVLLALMKNQIPLANKKEVLTAGYENYTSLCGSTLRAFL